MTVVTLPAITPKQSHWTYKSNSASFPSPTNSAIQTVGRPGGYWVLSMDYPPLTGTDRSRMMGFQSSLDGMANRVYLHDHTYSGPSGSLTVTEMLNVTFNATNWEASTAAGDRGSISDISGGVRFTGIGSSGVVLKPTTSTDAISTPTAGVSYAATLSVSDPLNGPITPNVGGMLLRWLNSNWGTVVADSATASAASRMIVAATCTDATAFYLRPYPTNNSNSNGWTQDLYNLSAARCLLVDNGFNALTYSEQFDNAAWTKTRSTITAGAVNGPDGSTTTADELVEDATASNNHYALQSYTRASVAEFWTGSIYIKENTSQRIRMDVRDSANGGYATFDANTGAITVAAAADGSAILSYASIHDAGNGWYRCRVTVKLTADTTARLIVYLCDGASDTISFNGDGTSGLYVWGAQLQRGGQLGRYTETTTAAVTGTDQTGSGCWVKGLDADTAGQLLPGDWMEIQGSGLHQVRADLDGDESGCGYVQFKPQLRNPPDDEAAVILHQPSMKAVLTASEVGWSNDPGVFSGFTLEAREIVE